MFRVACGSLEKGGWQLPPSEFWGMTPKDWWEIYDFNIGEDIKADEERDERLGTILQNIIKKRANKK